MDFGQEMKDRLAPLQRSGDDLDFWVDCAAALIQPIADIVFDQDDGTPGWATIMSADTCPTAYLPWLAQFRGVTLDPALDDYQQRLRIKQAPAELRGSPAALVAAVQAVLKAPLTDPSNWVRNPNFFHDPQHNDTTPPIGWSVVNPGGGLPGFQIFNASLPGSPQVCHAIFDSNTAGQGMFAPAPDLMSFKSGQTYSATVKLAGNFPQAVRITLGGADDSAHLDFTTQAWGTGPHTYTLSWTPTANRDATTHGLTIAHNEAPGSWVEVTILDTAIVVGSSPYYVDGDQGGDLDWAGTPGNSRTGTRAHTGGTPVPGTVILRERFNPISGLADPYHFQVITLTDQTPDVQAAIQALNEQKPAGLVMHYGTMQTQDYEALAGHTYDWVRSNYSTYDDVRMAPPS